MKRQFQYITLIALCVIFTNEQLIFAQDRGAIWVHGLNASNSEWNNWAGTFTGQRRLVTRNRIQNGNNWNNYNSEQGVVSMGNNVLNDYVGNPRNIYFGHSMGGVVGRQIDVNNNNNNGSFGGIITAGSPFDGARIANSARNNDTNWWAYDGVDRVTRGPLRQFGIGSINILDFNVANLLSWLLFPVFDVFNLRESNNQGVTDLAENSNYMNSGIRNAQTNTPKIHIWGNEDSQGFWRLTSQAIGNGDDNQWLNVANTAGDVYEVAMWVNIGLAIASGWWTFGFGAVWYIYTADGWSTGADWWRDGADRGWNYLIGSGIPSTNTICYQALNSQGFNDCMNSSCQGGACNGSNAYPIYMSCQQQNTYTQCYTYFSSANGQSDAFIKAPSQQGFNSAWSNGAVKIEAQGVNHLEMKKHDTMRDIYNGIFDGQRNADFFFNTDRQ